MNCLLSRASLVVAWTFFALFSAAWADSPAVAEIKVLQKEYDRRARDANESVLRWYVAQLQELKRTGTQKGDAGAAGEVDRELGEKWYRERMGRPPVADAAGVWLPLKKLRADAQSRREKAVDPLTRKFRGELEAILRRTVRSNDAEGEKAVRKAWREVLPLAPTEAEVTAWLVGTRWAWWGAETIEFEANGRARYVLGTTVKEMSWKLHDPYNVLLAFGNAPPAPGADRLEMFWTHCINHSQGGRTWTINRLDP